MADDVRRGILDLSSFIEIADSDHQLILSLTFRQALALSEPHNPN